MVVRANNWAKLVVQLVRVVTDWSVVYLVRVVSQSVAGAGVSAVLHLKAAVQTHANVIPTRQTASRQ